MSTAFTPGLTVTNHALVRKTRRLPLKGEVLVEVGDQVEADTIVARTELPGPLINVHAAEKLGIEPQELRHKLFVHEGERVEKGELLGEVKALFGLLTSRCEAPVSGTVEFISEVTGNVGIRQPPTPVELTAYIPGTVKEIIGGEGAVIETRGALVQGIFGVGGERHGTVKAIATSPDETTPAEQIVSSAGEGEVLILGGQITHEALRAAIKMKAAAVVGGSIMDTDLKKLLGYDIGVAITGHEDLPLTVIVTEGFGNVPMADRTFELLRSLNGMRASVNGATQIRAGVIRPEIIVPRPEWGGEEESPPTAQTELEVGVPIRLIREPFFGCLAKVHSLPNEPQRIETGALVRVLTAQLADGRIVTVPRANVEIIETK